MGYSSYRSCWHEFRNPLFLKYPHSCKNKNCSFRKAVYNPQAFFPHAASLRQAFAHCGRFSTAASRRSGTRVSVSLLGAMLSHPLPVIGLVGYYSTNYLIGHRPIPFRKLFRVTFTLQTYVLRDHRLLALLSKGYGREWGMYLCVTNPFATTNCKQLAVRLACLIHAANVHPEPRSNSQLKLDYQTFELIVEN